MEKQQLVRYLGMFSIALAGLIVVVLGLMLFLDLGEPPDMTIYIVVFFLTLLVREVAKRLPEG